MKRLVFTLILALAAAGALHADLETAVDIAGLVTATRDSAGDPLFGLLAKGDLTFTAVANPNVKAVAEILGLWSGNLLTAPADILKRLYVKVDFGGLVLLLGKGRVSWGEGFVFNAGDVIFGSLNPVTDLTQTLLRDQTDWLTDLTLTLGDFSYVEAIFLPYSTISPSAFPYTDVYHLRGGGRFVTNLGGLKLETGYLFKADEAAHHPYLSLQGNLFFDFNLSAGWKIPAAGYSEEKLKQGLAISAGLFQLFQIEGGSALTVRLEAAVRPFGLWQEPVSPSAANVFGLLLYPEITFSPSDVIALQLRAMVNPIAGSGLAMAGASLGLYQGFTLLGYVWTMWGDGNDTLFKFGTGGDMGVYLGIDFIY